MSASKLAAAMGVALFATASAPQSAAARDLFVTSLTVGPDTRVVSTNKLREVPELFDDESLASLFPGYTPLSSVSAQIDFRGLPATVSLTPQITTAALIFEVPGVLSVRFDAASREQAEEAFEDWLRGDFNSATAPSGAVGDLLHALVEHSPVDPVAGNPDSLLSRMFDADWRVGIEGPFLPGSRGSWSGGGEEESGDAGGLFSTGPDYAHTESGPYSVDRLELPLSYRTNFGDVVSLILDLPLTATWTEGQLSGLGSLGAGLQIRPTAWWSLTPMGRVGAVGSEHVGALAAIYSGAITNRFTIPIGPLELGLATLFGASHTIDDIEVSGVELEYDLSNQQLKNGVQLSGPVGAELLGAPLGFEAFASHTRTFGDDLYLESMGEVGAALVLFGDLTGVPYHAVQLGAAYLFGNDVDGVEVELRFRF